MRYSIFWKFLGFIENFWVFCHFIFGYFRTFARLFYCGSWMMCVHCSYVIISCQCLRRPMVNTATFHCPVNATLLHYYPRIFWRNSNLITYESDTRFVCTIIIHNIVIDVMHLRGKSMLGKSVSSTSYGSHRI